MARAMSAPNPWKALGPPPPGNLSRPLSNLDVLMQCFVGYRGLYIVGSGASLPHVPLARQLDRLAASAFLAGGSFSAHPAQPDERTRRMVAEYYAGHQWDHFDPHDHRAELITHMELEQAFLHELRALVKARMQAMPSADLHEIDGVRLFRAFHPGQVMVYNLDGLLAALERARHAFCDLHGTPPDFLADEETQDWIEVAGGTQVWEIMPEVNIDERERPDNPYLNAKLARLWTFRPQFIAIIGYTFARQPDGSINDWVSLREFIRRFRTSRGHVFVIEPIPEPLSELLHKKLLATIVPVPVKWNLLEPALIAILVLRRAAPLPSGTRSFS